LHATNFRAGNACDTANFSARVGNEMGREGRGEAEMELNNARVT